MKKPVNKHSKVHVLDTSGQLCPYPLVKTKAALKKIQKGDCLKIISTDPASELDFKVFCETTDHALLQILREENRFIFVIQK